MLGRLVIGPQTAVCADPRYGHKVITPDATTLIYLFFYLSLPSHSHPLSLQMLLHVEPSLTFMFFFKCSVF